MTTGRAANPTHDNWKALKKYRSTTQLKGNENKKGYVEAMRKGENAERR
jgi:hypothetical protein